MKCTHQKTGHPRLQCNKEVQATIHRNHLSRIVFAASGIASEAREEVFSEEVRKVGKEPAFAEKPETEVPASSNPFRNPSKECAKAFRHIGCLRKGHHHQRNISPRRKGPFLTNNHLLPQGQSCVWRQGSRPQATRRENKPSVLRYTAGLNRPTSTNQRSSLRGRFGPSPLSEGELRTYSLRIERIPVAG